MNVNNICCFSNRFWNFFELLRGVRECSPLIFLNAYLAYKTRQVSKNSVLRFMVVKILEVHLFIRN